MSDILESIERDEFLSFRFRFRRWQIVDEKQSEHRVNLCSSKIDEIYRVCFLFAGFIVEPRLSAQLRENE